MKKTVLILLVLALTVPAFARSVDAVVSADWLEANLSKVVVVDMRKVDDYKAGHVPGAVSLQGLYIAKDGLSNEVPMADELSELIAEAGIAADSTVVVVESDGARFAWATRAAWTLVYAGIPNVAVLDGGFAVWTKAGKAVKDGFESRPETKFMAKLNPAYIATKDDMLKGLKKTQIIDARAYDTHFGLAKAAFVDQYGHIAGAVSLPAAWITKDGMVRPLAELEEMVKAVKLNPKKASIVHCDSGVLCTAWWWILTQQMGWMNVKSYDGSAQEISKEPSVKFVKYVCK